MAGPIKGEKPTSVSLEFITPAYKYEVVHRSGKTNMNADTLSRAVWCIVTCGVLSRAVHVITIS